MIVIKNAYEHNLKHIDLSIPRGKMIVVTGVSGSGKTSLAFDTIYAEGQRRYAESLSSYARQFIARLDKPKVESITGLSPTISIDQRTTNYNPRSTVGTVTEIYDYLRLLYARIGIAHCPKCGREVHKQTLNQICEQIMNMENGTKFMILAPIVRNKKGEFEKLFDTIRKNGFIRAKIDGEMHELDDEIKLAKTKKHTIEIVIDRLSLNSDIRQRLIESLETATKLTNGLVIIETQSGMRNIFSQNFSCADCEINIEEIEPRSFSFNSPSGACHECSGLGFNVQFDPNIFINENISINAGAINVPGFNSNKEIFEQLAIKHGFSLNVPYAELSDKVKQILLYGDDFNYQVEVTKFNRKQVYNYTFDGVINTLQRRYRDTTSAYMKSEYESLMTNTVCKTCNGKRLKQESLAVTINNQNIYDVTQIPISDLNLFFNNGISLKEFEKTIAMPILNEIITRVNFLQDVGLGYLTLGQSANTLSGGEAQRIRLATQIGCGLTGVIYVLDEPSIGLHQHDNMKLIETLKKLKNLGNTLIIVEHDLDTIKACDYLIDVGPFAGVHGGEILYTGSPKDISHNDKSVTAQYLTGELEISPPISYRQSENKITIVDAYENNLKHINVEVPLNVFTCVTGLSGSGKSSLINEILYKSLARDLNHAKLKPGKHSHIEGIKQLDKVINIDQAPIGRTPRSNPATYTQLFELIRDVFTQLPEAKARGYDKGRFSFNVKGGRCETCLGDGIIKIEMQFMADVYIECDECKGKRYNRETLDVKYKGKTIADVLDMTVDEALEFFAAHQRIISKLKSLEAVGLGYIKLGQASTTLSGGEAQRIKLAAELSKRSTGRTMYVLDEPTTGLHMFDVHKLINILQRLVDAGNTVIVIEHNIDVIKSCDYVIDMGPVGGRDGGFIIATGTPKQIADNKNSLTGRYL